MARRTQKAKQEAATTIPATSMLEALTTRLEAAGKGDDPEEVRHVRVLSRRIDTWLRLYKPRRRRHGKLRSELRRLRHACAAARDIDVLRAGDPHLLDDDELASQREVEQRQLRRVVSSPRIAELLEALGELPPIERDFARENAVDLVDAVLVAGAEVSIGKPDPELLHRLRRLVRRVRYAAAMLDHVVPGLEAFQDQLGHVSDLALRRRFLGKAAVRRRDVIEAASQALKSWRRVEATLNATRDRWSAPAAEPTTDSFLQLV